jgi:hypothetical protein
VLLGLLGAMAAIVAGFAIADEIPCWLKIYLGVTATVLILGALVCIWSFFPNTKTLKGSPKPNLYFWGDIADFNEVSDYEKEIEKTESEDAHIEAQSIQVARIIRRKHRFFVTALNILVSAIFPPFWIVWGILLLRKKIIKKRRKGSEK